MFKKRPKRCGKNNKDCIRLLGPVLISLGVGIFLANIIPAYMLIVIFGIALICAGIWFLAK